MNVVLVIIDTLRLDHMGCYADCYLDGGRAKTPHLDRLAADSLRFRRAAPESLPTLPMRRAVHTGQRVWPFHDHRHYKGDFVGAPGWGPIREDQDTLAELLQKAGYRTAFVSDTYHQFKPSKNFARGFLQWTFIRGQEIDFCKTGPPVPREVALRHIPESKRNDKFVQRHVQYLTNVQDRRSEEDYFAAQVFRTAADWLYQNQDADKYFLVVDSFDPHEPWDPPLYYRKMYDPDDDGVADVIWALYGQHNYTERELRRMRANYAGEVTMVDRWFGHFYDAFLAAGRPEETLFILTTDHGHYLGDRGWTGKMGQPMLREIIDTPILLRDPHGRAAGQANDAFVSHTDIAATILEAAGVTAEQPLEGRSLLPALAGEKLTHRDHTLTGWGPFITIRTDRWLYNASLWGQNPMLFDWVNDPRCERNVAAEHPDVVKMLYEVGVADCGGKYPEFLRKMADAALPGCTPLGKW